jgi:hypothetical protein
MGLKVFSNFHDPKLFEDSLQEFKDKPISIMYDWPCAWDNNGNGALSEKLWYNKINIIILGEPNEYFNLHKATIMNQHAYKAILSWSDWVLDQSDRAVLFPFGTSWLRDEYIKKMENPVNKKFEVSFLRGAKKKAPGHDLRWDIYDRKFRIDTPTKFFDVLDDFNPSTGFHTDQNAKEIVWDESMFHISIENHSHNGYFTEKVVDAFLTKTVPIYWGCKDIDKYFDTKGMILFETYEEAIEKINNLTEEDYHSRKEYMDKNYKLALHYADFFGRFRDWLKDFIEINKI